MIGILSFARSTTVRGGERRGTAPRLYGNPLPRLAIGRLADEPAHLVIKVEEEEAEQQLIPCQLPSISDAQRSPQPHVRPT